MIKENSYFYEIAEQFRLDPDDKILYHGDLAVSLKPKAAEILVVLVENAGTIVGKKDLMDAVWRETFVEENNLSVNIYELRKAFARVNDTAKFIETIPRRGFRFNASVKKISAKLPPLLAEKTASQNHDRRPLQPRHRAFAPVFAVLCVLIIGTGSFFAWRPDRMSNGLPAAAGQQIEKRNGTDFIEAHQLYLRGRELWQTRSNSQMEKGIEFFRRAIEIDPNYAAPYTGLADSFSMMRNDPEDWRHAEEYARRAIALDPLSADAHASLAFIMAMDKWQWADAEQEFTYALTLDETSGKAHQWYATLLGIERRYDEADAHLKRAIEIEPLSPNYNADLCEMKYYAGRYDDAFAQCSRAHEINPDFAYDYALRNIYIAQKRYDEAAQEVIENEKRLGATDEAIRSAPWFRAYKRDGFRGWMESDIGRVPNRADVLLNYSDLSLGYALLEDREKTLDYLEKCLAGHAFLLPFANTRPEYDFLRDDPRFQSLMRQVGLARN